MLCKRKPIVGLRMLTVAFGKPAEPFKMKSVASETFLQVARGEKTTVPRNMSYEFVRRIHKNYFDKKRERGNFVDWRHIIQIIEFSETEEDVVHFETKNHEQNFKKIPNVNLNEWHNEDERKKERKIY